MENKDLKFIKKHYGEDFMHLCRSLFPTILEQDGLLSEIISSRFAPTRSIYEDMTENEDVLNAFKNYIFNAYHEMVTPKTEETSKKSSKTPEELLDEAGYILFPECKTEEEIQSFKKYWQKDEKLCTFKYGNRLNTCRVWFAVKKNVDEIKRENFTSPERQDEYGTSAISIQFTRGLNSTLSIKNRYNHTVKNPDATFSNNLDNIIEGLTDSFVETYNIDLYGEKQISNFRHFVMDNSGKLHRFNGEFNGFFCCDNNKLIYQGNVIELVLNRYILFNSYLIDLKNNTIKSFDARYKYIENIYYNYNIDGNNVKLDDDSFTKSIGKIKKITVTKGENHERTVVIKPKDGIDIIITIDKNNRMTSFYNANVTKIGNNFLRWTVFDGNNLKSVDLPNVKKIGNDFMASTSNNKLVSINLPRVEKVGDNFLRYAAKDLQKLDLPNLKKIGDKALVYCMNLQELNLPKVKTIGDDFLAFNEKLVNLNLPELEKVKVRFISENRNLKTLFLPKLNYCEGGFLQENRCLQNAFIPCLTPERIEDSDLAFWHPQREELLKKINENNEKYNKNSKKKEDTLTF